MARVARMFDASCALAVLLVTFMLLNIERMPDGLDDFLAVRVTVKNLVLIIGFIIVWPACFEACGLYKTHSRASIGANTFAPSRIVLACTLATLFLSLFVLTSSTGAFGVEVIVYFWVGSVLSELLGRAALARGATYLDRRAHELKQTLIIGSGPRAVALDHHSQTRHAKDWLVVGFVDTRDPDDIPAEIRDRMLAPLEGLEDLLCSRPIDQVLVALPVKSCYTAIQRALETCERVGVEARYFPDIFPSVLARHAFADEDELPAVRLPLVADDHRLVVKRVIDIVLGVCGIVALAPVLAVSALVIKLTSPGPVLFSQVRYGYNRRQFRLYKFRTMVQDAEDLQAGLESRNEAEGPVFKIRADPRVTRCGRIMRKLSIDELPQLINVVKGEMSLVGPRPLPVRDVLRFNGAWLMRRFSVKPGITCLWQVNGRSETAFDQWVKQDLDYIDNWSLTLDMRILLKTVPAVLSGSGAM